MSIDYSIKAHPTTYNGRLYRSRLEARWAAFFDLLGWRFEYEPIDLNGWSPDFVLIGAKQSIYVEVKPIEHFDMQTAVKIMNALPDTSQEALLVGSSLPISRSGMGERNHRCVGWLLDSWTKRDVACEWMLAPFAWYSALPQCADFTSEEHDFSGRITGYNDGGRWGSAERKSSHVEQLWAQAGNAVQWQCGAAIDAQHDFGLAEKRPVPIDEERLPPLNAEAPFKFQVPGSQTSDFTITDYIRGPRGLDQDFAYIPSVGWIRWDKRFCAAGGWGLDKDSAYLGHRLHFELQQYAWKFGKDWTPEQVNSVVSDTRLNRIRENLRIQLTRTKADIPR